MNDDIRLPLDTGDVRGITVGPAGGALVPLTVHDEERGPPLITALLRPHEARRLAAMLLTAAEEATS